jgi:hypothetical protein
MDPFLHIWDVEDPEAVWLCGIIATVGLIYFGFQLWRIKRRAWTSPSDAP